ncbi:MAG: UDP-N-acetylglucosamine 1-carboxyvinyltransferase [Alphaproteobacteria bacterium CG_4_10_14_0_8_um_filter_37_21]|nr:MAG: UDP-N-acetylglucosamine 1-carboxyvinyltransferase [Alphaproteobacteria bacterium CG_4_10_14_0_8_um_filter_37_21]
MLSVLKIQGGVQLKGEVKVSGAKNAALPLLTTCLLTDQKMVFKNTPRLSDIFTLVDLLEKFGVSSGNFDQNTLELKASNITTLIAPYDLVRKMRASILVLGPLVARFGEAKVSLPGGCAIGTRPVDIHLAGLKALGCDIEIDQGYIIAKAPKGLIGNTFTMPVITVTGTENLMMAATLAKGDTTLINAAREPEIVDLANCLIAMGAKITGAGTDTICITGVPSLGGATHTILPDRIETGTFAMLAGITKGDLKITNTNLNLIPGVTQILTNAGIELKEEANGFRATSTGKINGIDIMTEPYPGFPTDLQAQTMALMSLCDGASMITETIFENRFMHVPELCRMGAKITVHGSSAMVRGVKELSGAPVMATDLRASVSLVMAALAAKGETTLNRVYHLDRGYENIEHKLIPCGAQIERIKIS